MNNNMNLSANLIYEALHTARVIGEPKTISAIKELRNPVQLEKQQEEKRDPIIDFIIKSCCAHFKISKANLIKKNSRSEQRDYCLCVIIHLLTKVEYCCITPDEIGKELGGLDRPAVSRRKTRFKTFKTNIKQESDAIYVASLVEEEIKEKIKSRVE